MLVRKAAGIGWSRPEFAKQAGISDQTAWRVETGQPESSVLAAHKMREALAKRGVDVAQVPVGVSDWQEHALASAAASAGDPAVRRNLIRFREQAGLDQFFAAVAAEIPYETLRAYELGEIDPPTPALRALAAAYERPPGHFFEPDPPPPAPAERAQYFGAPPEVIAAMTPEERAQFETTTRNVLAARQRVLASKKTQRETFAAAKKKNRKT